MSQAVMGSPFDPAAALGPLRRGMALVRLARGALHGLLGGGLAGVLLLVVDRVYPFSVAHWLAPAALLAGVLLGIALAVRHWPSLLEAARAADRHFGLQDRLTTALELRSSPAPLAAVQREDTARSAAGLRLTSSRGRWADSREVVTALALVAVLALLLVAGRPVQKVRVVAAAPASARIHRVVTHFPLLRNITGNPANSPNNAAQRRLEVALARLQQQLLRAVKPATALRAISATQQQLHSIAASLHPINQQAVTQLNHALGPGLTGRQSAHPTSRDQINAATRALNRLARTLAHLTPSQRAALAAKLARAANKVSDATLRAALHQSASSLAYNDPQTASAALRQASAALAQSPGNQQTQAQLSSAIGKLESLKGQVSGLQAANGNPTAAGGQPVPGAPGSNAGKGAGAQGLRGLGTGTGKGAGAKGAGAGTTRASTGGNQGQGTGGPGSGRSINPGSGATGRGPGRGTGLGSSGVNGPGGTGAHGSSGSRGNAGGLGAGHFVTVYAPQHLGKGPQTVEKGPNGAPLPGSFVPYQEVIRQYSASAHAALGRTALPPSLQSYVRSYFTTISH